MINMENAEEQTNKYTSMCAVSQKLAVVFIRKTLLHRVLSKKLNFENTDNCITQLKTVWQNPSSPADVCLIPSNFTLYSTRL